MATAPPRPSEMKRRPAETVSVPFRNSTRALSATRTSEARFGSRGLTATTVSSRSVATTWTEPLTTSTETVIGCGVGNVGMISPQCVMWVVSGPSR